MAEPKVLFVKPGAIRASDKGKLTKAGVVVVEIDDPASARFVAPSYEGAEMPGGDLLAAMARGVKRLNDYGRSIFAEELADAILARKSTPTKDTPQ